MKENAMIREEMAEVFKDLFPFWRDLSKEDREYLLDNSGAITYLGGTTIHDGTECTGVILIKRGSLRVYMMSEDGKDLTLYRLFDGDMCMMSASCVLESITYDVCVDAEENSECYQISGPAFSYLAGKYPYMKIFALEATTNRFSDVMYAVEQIFFMNIEKRLALFLLDEMSKTGSATIRLTHEQIAKYMGSAREVVSRTLKNFAAKGIVSLSRGGTTILDKKSLRNLTV